MSPSPNGVSFVNTHLPSGLRKRNSTNVEGYGQWFHCFMKGHTYPVEERLGYFSGLVTLNCSYYASTGQAETHCSEAMFAVASDRFQLTCWPMPMNLKIPAGFASSKLNILRIISCLVFVLREIFFFLEDWMYQTDRIFSKTKWIEFLVLIRENGLESFSTTQHKKTTIVTKGGFLWIWRYYSFPRSAAVPVC